MTVPSFALPNARRIHSRLAEGMLANRAYRRCAVASGDRKLALYLAHVACGLPIKVLAREVDRAPAQVRRVIAEVEDARDCWQLSARLDQIELEVMS